MSERKGPSVGCFIAAASIGLAGLGFLLLILAALFGGGSAASTAPEKIAHLDLEGVITSAGDVGFMGPSQSMVERMAKDLKRAREDKTVKAIVLRINSPGGEVTAADTIYHHVKKTAAVKPVVVYMDSVAASGGFYVACGAGEILANQTTMTGSIGVIIASLNYGELFDKLGMETMVFKSGRFKDILSGTRPMREDEKALIQDMVDQTYERFLEVVREARPKIPETRLRQEIADGRILSGKDAAELGLIDGLGYIEDAYDRARELANAPDAKAVKYSESVSVFKVLGLSMASALNRSSPSIELRLPSQPEFRPEPGLIYLLPSFYGP